MQILRIYTDGGCSNNQCDENLGGWGAILEYGNASKELCGGEINTTNNRMEMTALINALSSLTRKNLHIQVFSDSSYLMECFRKGWYIKWQSNGWINSQKKPVENKDLWEELLDLINGQNIEFYRVKGHVSLNHPNTNLHGLYSKFKDWNGEAFSYDDFLYITKMNIRADDLVHEGMKKVI